MPLTGERLWTKLHRRGKLGASRALYWRPSDRKGLAIGRASDAINLTWGMWLVLNEWLLSVTQEFKGAMLEIKITTTFNCESGHGHRAPNEEAPANRNQQRILQIRNFRRRIVLYETVLPGPKLWRRIVRTAKHDGSC